MLDQSDVSLCGLLFQTLLREMCSVAKSQLETAMDTLIEVFQCYSSREGDRFKLNFVELRSLLRLELNLEVQTVCVSAVSLSGFRSRHSLLSVCVSGELEHWVRGDDHGRPGQE